METLLILIVAALLIGFVIALGTGAVPKRRRRGRDRQEEVAPGVERDPGRGRPAGPGAEGQHSTDAGTLHPPSQSPEREGGPDAVPPYRAGGSVDPERPSRSEGNRTD